MRVHLMSFVAASLAAAATAGSVGTAAAGSGGTVSGKVTYPDGTLCRSCGPISAATAAGVTDRVFTDSSGRYTISLANPTLEKIFMNGDAVWTGSRSCAQGCSIDLVRR